MGSMLSQIVAEQPKPEVAQTGRPDLPPLIAYDLVSVYVKDIVDEETGEITGRDFQPVVHKIGKVAAGLNGSIDRIRESIAKRDGKGYGNLEGYELFCTAVEPSAQA